MGVFVFREGGAKLARPRNQRPSHVRAFLTLVIGLLESSDNQRPDRSAGPLRPMAQPVVQGLRYIDGRSDCHDMIVSHGPADSTALCHGSGGVRARHAPADGILNT